VLGASFDGGMFAARGGRARAVHAPGRASQSRRSTPPGLLTRQFRLRDGTRASGSTGARSGQNDVPRGGRYLRHPDPARGNELEEATTTLAPGARDGRATWLGVFAKHVVHPERSAKNGVSTQPFPAEESPG
jgi:hypothetical protein